MPCHRAASPRSLALRSLVLTGATLSASLFSPLAAVAAPTVTGSVPTGRTGTTTTGGAGCTASTTDVSADELGSALADAEPGEVVCLPGAENSADHAHPGGREAERTHRHSGAPHSRPASEPNGERQSRNGCGQGYLTDDCEQFSVHDLLHDSIDPLL